MVTNIKGHGDYPEEQVIENPAITVEGIDDPAKKNKWEYYVNQVYEMDQFAGNTSNSVFAVPAPTDGTLKYPVEY